MPARSAACVLILAALVALPAAAQQVHRWVDAQGQVHYGDRPQGAEVTRLRIRAESATAPSGEAPVAAATTASGRAAGRPAVPAAASGAMPSRAPAPPPRGAASATASGRDVALQRVAANGPGPR